MERPFWGAALALPLALLLGCSEDVAAPTPTPTPTPTSTSPSAAETATEKVAPAPEPAAPDPASLLKRGKVVYATNCTACHNPDPALDGALGPGITGSSRELIEKRVLRGTYPDGYEPKRDSRVMMPLPHLAPDIDALTTYLNQ